MWSLRSRSVADDAQLFALGSLREAAPRRRLTQESLGARSGLHRNYVGAIERGEINPSFRILLRLTRGLALPMSELVALYERHRARRDA